MSERIKAAVIVDREIYENFKLVCLTKHVKPTLVLCELMEHYSVEHAKAHLDALSALLPKEEVQGETAAA